MRQAIPDFPFITHVDTCTVTTIRLAPMCGYQTTVDGLTIDYIPVINKIKRKAIAQHKWEVRLLQSFPNSLRKAQ